MSETYQRISRHGPSVTTRGQEIEETTIVQVHDDNPGITRTQLIIQFVTGVISSLLLLRFLLALFGANPDNGLVSLLYSVTRPLTALFQGFFDLNATAGDARFELETIVAIIAYTLVGLAAVRLLDIFRNNN